MSARRFYESLSERQREIALLVAKGLSNPQIAMKLHVSVRTVKTHLTIIAQKFAGAARFDRMKIARCLWDLGVA